MLLLTNATPVLRCLFTRMLGKCTKNSSYDRLAFFWDDDESRLELRSGMMMSASMSDRKLRSEEKAQPLVNLVHTLALG